jgi:hypothetical protein
VEEVDKEWMVRVSVSNQLTDLAVAGQSPQVQAGLHFLAEVHWQFGPH